MKHILIADKSMLVGDDLADVLIDYAAILGDTGHADSVTFTAYSPDGNEVEATFLLNSGSNIVIETTNSRLPEPDNESIVSYMQTRIDGFRYPQPVQPQETQAAESHDFDLPEHG